MLEDDVRAATPANSGHRIATRNDVERSSKPPNQQRPLDHRQGKQSHSELPPLTPIIVSYEKLLPMIRELFNFRWPGPIKADPAKRDHSKKCAYHKEHGHTTEQCRSLHYLVERLIKAGYLKQYIHSMPGAGRLPRVEPPGPPGLQLPLGL
ncbi:hypothetical protein CK203_082349 [Vitis vinifera]|uniref:Uncharacterized protein n=1 Tax=Vitis vinifera TaxID=29760 RepID=A0A438DSH7_VITVI|nr:hypothetical protein CK203_082349 [Vitis vinifera]